MLTFPHFDTTERGRELNSIAGKYFLNIEIVVVNVKAMQALACRAPQNLARVLHELEPRLVISHVQRFMKVLAFFDLLTDI